VQAERASPAQSVQSFEVPILIVSYSRPQDVAACVRALARMAIKPRFELFVAENGGAAAFDALLSELAGDGGPCVEAAATGGSLVSPIAVRHRLLRMLRGDGAPGAFVHLAEMPENLGYAGGVNAWLRPLLQVEDWEGAWVLNPDTEPEPSALAELVDYAVTCGKGLVGSRLVLKSDRTCLQTRGLSWSKLRGTVVAVDGHAPSTVEPDAGSVERRLDAPSGASLYATRELIELIGPMREHYFLYFEDLDWGVRAKKRGESVGYAHASIVLHQGGSTIGSARLRRERSRLSVYLDTRNRLLFVREHHPFWLPWSIAVGLAELAAFAVAGSISNFTAAFLGLMAGISGETGKPTSFASLIRA
jgi:N-acetylglucosaminyl-diphospho-decaprenol L-rhamnosyltransferase